MAQRLIVVYNPRSSKQARIKAEVLDKAKTLGGYMVGRYEVKPVPVDENATELSKVLVDGDLVVAAGGDGTGTMVLNAAMISERDVTLGVLGYGNFNDFAGMLGTKSLERIIADFESGTTQRLFPIEAVLDGKHFRYAACYFTIGMFAESTEIFDAPDNRKSLKKGKKSLLFSIFKLAGWYFRNKKREFLPKDIQLDDVPMNRMKVTKSGRENRVMVAPSRRISDVLFVNGETIAKLMKGGEYWQSPEEFYVSFGRLKGFFRLCAFMLKSMFTKVPGKKVAAKAEKTAEVKIDFSGPEEFEIQAEGEYRKVKAKELIVRKSERGVKVVL